MFRQNTLYHLLLPHLITKVEYSGVKKNQINPFIISPCIVCRFNLFFCTYHFNIRLPGGLLNSKAGFKSDTLWSSAATITSLTDNNVDTNEKTITNRWYWFDLGSSKNISNYKLLGGTVTIAFFDTNKNQIGSPIENQYNTGEQVAISYLDVRYVALRAINTGNTIKEFDIFEQISTPEPTVTPSPTPDPAPTPAPTPEIPSGDRAILTVTMTTGSEKEFDLPLSEVNVFLQWYDSATGSARYGIDKHDNNKGPFSKRTEYVIHDKILTFEVSEYTTTE
ncbi:hypothetical protein [Paenibacillus donghaensis]|uniref:hypothetical protein n=1 Tax=Paenibacillus donghaensis TaxID=414771 RepID=UPI001B808BBD|nr:hypothetical protein [Paenibacillus donghaensis]